MNLLMKLRYFGKPENLEIFCTLIEQTWPKKYELYVYDEN